MKNFASPEAVPFAQVLATSLPAIAVLLPWIWWILEALPALGTFSDSIDYLVLSEYYSRHFRDVVPQYAVAFFGQSRFPPLFPLALAAVDASPLNLQPALLLSGAFAILAVVATSAWYVTEIRPTWVSALLVLVGTAAAAPMLQLINPVSEPFMQMLLMPAFILAARRPRPGSSLIVLAALVGLIPLARMAGVALVAAFVIWLIRRSDVPRRQGLLYAVVALLPASAWLGYRSLLPIEESYVASLSAQRMLDAFGGWLGLLSQPLNLLSGLASVFDPLLGPLAWAGATLVVILAVLALPSRLRSNSLDAWYTMAYVGLVLIWPYPAEATRLMSAILPVVLLQAWNGASLVATAGAGREWSTRQWPALFAVAWVIACMPAWWHIVHRASLPIDPDLERYRRSPAYFMSESDELAIAGTGAWARIVAMAEELPQVVPRNDCVYTFFPAMIWVLSGQRTRVKPIPSDVARGRMSLDQLRDCRFLMPVNTSSAQTGVPPLYPLDALRDRTRPVLKSEFAFRDGRVVAAVLLERTDLGRHDD